MTLFWLICAAMLIVAVLFVAIPLWRGISKSNSVERDAANLEILRDQIAEMDNDLKNGLLTPELHAQGKSELQARLLEEVSETKKVEAANQARPLKIIAIALSILLPLASVGLYLKVGNPNALVPQIGLTGAGGIVHDQASLNALEEKSAQNPNDPEVLFTLARSYVELARYADAARKYESLTKLVPNEAMLWADYADALAMTHSSLLGAPTKLLDRALELDPNLAKALALSGTAAMERGDYAAAVNFWGRLRRQLQDGSDDAKMIDQGLQQAQQLLAQSTGGKAAPVLDQINQPSNNAPAAGKERITGTVSLSDALKRNADPDDTVFVLARAAQGPKMPLAILRKQVKDLPVKFTLDDSMAMSPAMKMSNFDQVVVIARISKSGNAMPQPGDLLGMSKPLALGSSGIKISIDQQVR
jgi:cytochrome c-type biogenesis protein CcmH